MTEPPPRAQQRAKPRRGDVLEIELESMDARGRLVGSYADETGEFVVLLRHGAPGDRVRAEVLRRRGHRVEARMAALLEPSEDRVEARCGHVGVCGGCTLQEVAYARQLEEKRRVTRELFAERGLGDVEVAPVLPCEPPWRYRNKMDFTYGDRRWVSVEEGPDADRGFALGLHPGRAWDRVFDVDECHIAFPGAVEIVGTARRLAKERGLSAWNPRHHTGLLRHLVLRRAEATGEILANLVTSEEAGERIGPYVEALLAEHPEVTTLVQNVGDQPAQIAIGEREFVHHGPARIVERLGGVAFEISARSFFQTNTRQAERMVELVRRRAEPRAGDVLHDLYCGAGTFTLLLASSVREVHGFEVVPEAVADAERNAAANGVRNVHFRAGDVADTLLSGDAPPADLVVVDPPRVGMHPKVRAALVATGARRIVYVSCNAKTAAADVAELVAGGWELRSVQPLDMFPHTAHLESVLVLERAP